MNDMPTVPYFIYLNFVIRSLMNYIRDHNLSLIISNNVFLAMYPQFDWPYCPYLVSYTLPHCRYSVQISNYIIFSIVSRMHLSPYPIRLSN